MKNDSLNTPSNHPHLLEALRESRVRLSNAQNLIEANAWDASYSALYRAICDALINTQEAIDRINDQPDDNRPGALVVRHKEPELIEVLDGEFCNQGFTDMSNLDELKQQLQAKIQANSKPEEPLKPENLLKNDELPQYQSQQRLREALEQYRAKQTPNI